MRKSSRRATGAAKNANASLGFRVEGFRRRATGAAKNANCKIRNCQGLRRCPSRAGFKIG